MRQFGQKIVSDYEEAQGAIREKQYERAIELLQGIIVVDPTYKATTRLLTEAVEARKAVPPWRQKWVLRLQSAQKRPVSKRPILTVAVSCSMAKSKP